MAPKTDRVHRVERMEFPTGELQSSRAKNSLSYHFNYGPSEDNQEYSANQLIEFLSVKPAQQKQCN